MKTLLFTLAILFAQQSYGQNPAQEKLVSVTFENNSPLLYKFALLAFRPGEDANETRITNMLPFTKKQYRFPVGTAIYIANAEQVNYTMSGKSIYKRGDKPYLIVSADKNNQTFKLLK